MELIRSSSASRGSGGSFRGSVISDVSTSSQKFSDARTSNETNATAPISLGWRESGSTGAGAGQAVPLEARISMRGKFKESMRELASDLLLRLNGLGIYGRERQLQQLEDAFERCYVKANDEKNEKDEQTTVRRRPQRKKQVVWIGGKAGSGKSALVDTFLADVTKPSRKVRPFVAVGKFDSQQAHEPYSGILEACVHLCASFFRDSDESLVPTLASKLREEMDVALLGILETYIPNLTQVMEEGSDDEDNHAPEQAQRPRRLSRISDLSNDQSEELGPMESLHRFQFAFKAFLRVVCNIRPLVMSWDDLQWSDDSSLELMKLLLSDSEQLDLLLIGCYREEELQPDDKLSVDLLRPWKGLPEHAQEGGIATAPTSRAPAQSAAISVRDTLKVEDVLALLKDFFRASEEEERLVDLAQTIQQRTNGEPFFVTQFLSNLVLEDFFHFSMQTLEWTWDLQEIQAKTRATTNVVELMDQRLRRLPPGASTMLKRLACLGFTVKKSIYELIARTSFSAQADEYLQLCISEGMLEEIDSNGGSLRWVHDKILEASLAGVSQEETARLKFEMGELLLDQLDDIQMESELFAVTNLLNEGMESDDKAPLNDKRRIQIVDLNLRAGKEALDASSFAPAAKYLEFGIALLQKDCWQTQYDLALEFFSSLAEAYGYQGKYELMEQSIDAVLAQKERPLLDKRRVYNVLLDSLAAQAKYQEGMEQGVRILRLLGCRFPTVAVPLHVVIGLLRAKVSAKKWINRDWSTYALLSDPSKRWIMVLLDKLGTCCYLLQSPLTAIVALKGMDYTRRYGICDHSPVMLGLVAFLLVGPLQDFATGKLYADVAAEMVERSQSKRAKARTMYLTNSLVYHWSQPIQTCQKRLFEAYKIGMAIGDQQSTAWAITNYLAVSYSFGVPLRVLYPDIITFRDQQKDFGQIQQYIIIDSLRWGSQALMGTSASIQSDPADDQEKPDDPTTYRMEIYTGAYLGDYERVVQVIEEHREMDTALMGTYGSSQQFMCMAISYLALARANKRLKRPYLKKAKRYIKNIKTAVDRGCPNDSHYEALLDAEVAALQGKTAKALKHYEIATLLAGRKGQTNDHALAQRRLGEYYLSIPELENSREEARYRITEAIRLNELWGATAIVDQLNEKYAELLAPVKTIMIDGKGDFSDSGSMMNSASPIRI